MFKKLTCFILIITISLGAVSCARKQETKPLTSAVDVSEDSGEVTTTTHSESKKDQKEEKESTKKGEEKEKLSSKKSEETKTEKSQSKTPKQKNNKPKKAQQKKSSPEKESEKSQTTTKKSIPTSKKADTISVSITIDCTAAVGKVEGIPNYYLNNSSIDLEKGSTAFSATKAACAKAGINIVATKTMYGEYISAIGSLAEKDTSKYSGWTYTVNGTYPPKAADKYTLENGDTIKWIYKA